MNNEITFGGVKVTIKDRGVNIGDKLPSFRAVKADMTDFNIDEYRGKVIVINSFPSIDTGICALQTIRFNNEVANYKDLVVVTVSKDLPFALKRFCGDNNIENAVTVSDYRYRDFEINIGGLMEELALLSRQVIVVDKTGTICHFERVSEVRSEPNFEEALNVIKKLY